MEPQPKRQRNTIHNLIPELQLLITGYLDFLEKVSLIESAILPLELIVSNKKLDEHDEYGKTLLHVAAEKSYRRATRLLLSAGASASIKMGKGARDPNTTPLIVASKQGDFPIVRMLVDHGAGVNEWDWSGIYPLHYASEHGHTRIVRFLLDSGAEQSYNFDIGCPLHLAVVGGHADIVRLLVAHGANLTIQLRGLTAFGLAILNSHPDCVQALLEGGANANEKSGCLGFSPLHLASDAYYFMSFVDIAIERSISEISQLQALIWTSTRKESYTKIVKLLVMAGADVSQETDSLTALHLASITGNDGSVKILLDAGADIHQRTARGRSALMFARLFKHDSVIQLLLAAKKQRPKEQRPAIAPKPKIRLEIEHDK